MVATCTVCGFHLKGGSGIKLDRLPCREPKALKCPLEPLSSYNLPLNRHTRICSQHLECRPRWKTILAASNKSGVTEKDNRKDSKEENDITKQETVEKLTNTGRSM